VLFFLAALALFTLEVRGREASHLSTLAGLVGAKPPTVGERIQAWIGRETGLGAPYAADDNGIVNTHFVIWHHGWPIPYLIRGTSWGRGNVATRATSPWAFDLGMTALNPIALPIDLVAVVMTLALIYLLPQMLARLCSPSTWWFLVGTALVASGAVAMIQDSVETTVPIGYEAIQELLGVRAVTMAEVRLLVNVGAFVIAWGGMIACYVVARRWFRRQAPHTV
jgi:hypothetical protein